MTLETDKVITLIQEQQKRWLALMDTDLDPVARERCHSCYYALADVVNSINQLHLPQEELKRKQKLPPEFVYQEVDENQKYEIAITGSGLNALHPRIPAEIIRVLKQYFPISPQRCTVQLEKNSARVWMDWDAL